MKLVERVSMVVERNDEVVGSDWKWMLCAQVVDGE